VQEALWKANVGRKDPLRRELMSADLARAFEESLSWATLEQVAQEGRLDNLTTSTLFCSGSGAYSRMHYDQNANLYLQIRGAKRWLLFSPEYSAWLYPYPKGHPLDRKARLNLEAPQVDEYPWAAELSGKGVVAEILPGDALWLPSHWWHAVQALEHETLALNFWWNPSPIPSQFTVDQVFLETARDLESFLQKALTPPAVEEFLRSWELDESPATVEVAALRTFLLMTLCSFRQAGGLATPHQAQRLRKLLNSRRYAGLQFAGTSHMALPKAGQCRSQPRASARSAVRGVRKVWHTCEQHSCSSAWPRRHRFTS